MPSATSYASVNHLARQHATIGVVVADQQDASPALPLALPLTACGSSDDDDSETTHRRRPPRRPLLRHPPRSGRRSARNAPPPLLKTYRGWRRSPVSPERGDAAQGARGALVAPKCDVSVHQLKYQTVGAEGRSRPPHPVRMMVPSGSDAACQGARPIVLYAHGTSADRAASTSPALSQDNLEGIAIADDVRIARATS